MRYKNSGKSPIFTNFKDGLLKFVKNRDFPIFHCFECKLYFDLRTAFVYNQSLQTLRVSINIKHVIFLLLLLL